MKKNVKNCRLILILDPYHLLTLHFIRIYCHTNIMKSSMNAISNIKNSKFTAIYSMIFVLMIISGLVSLPNCGIKISNAAGTNRKGIINN